MGELTHVISKRWNDLILMAYVIKTETENYSDRYTDKQLQTLKEASNILFYNAQKERINFMKSISDKEESNEKNK